MNKQEAAEYLNISVRTLQRLTADGAIIAGMVKGKTGLVTDYTKDDLDAYKKRAAEPQQRDDTRYVKPHVIPSDAPSQALQRAGNGMSVEALELITTRLSETFEESPFAQEMRELAKRMTNALEAIQAQGSASSEADSLPLEEKLTLSIDDAARLSGLSANHIYAAVRAGKLKGKIVGRGWRVKRPDLDAYVKKL